MISSEILEQARQTIFDFDKDKAEQIIHQVVSGGENPLELLEKAFIPAINEIGEKFSIGEMFLPELIQAAGVMKHATDLISEALPKEEKAQQQKGVVVIGTVEGDIHDIGKTLVVTLLDVHGLAVHDLGRDVPIDDYVAKVKEKGADVVGSSALLTTTMPKQKELEEALKEAGLRKKVKMIVGGAPATQRWADRIGADAYGEDAHDAVRKIRELLEQVV
jgi:trimethylamine corrinoid protein